MEISFLIYAFYIYAHFPRTQLGRKTRALCYYSATFFNIKEPCIIPSLCMLLMNLRERKLLLTIGIYNVELVRFL
jgi:hypothetical protein